MIEINRIVHAGDLHIFQSKNFHIHDYVFNEFYRQLENEQPDLCVITGDVVDSKIKLSPEQIDLCRNFFLNVSSYCPIIVIPGNHDQNLQNSDRIDSLSPIIHSVYYECIHPIHFLKHSGMYQLYGINWAVWSCFDDQQSPFKIGYEATNYTIGLYHGVVNGCVSENGMVLTGGVNVSEFDKTDITLMSDIHNCQGFRNNEIHYSGSFIQTKTSEKDEGTYLIWEWDKNTFHPSIKKLGNIYSTISHEVDELLNSEIEIKDEKQTVIIKYDPDKISKTDINAYRKELSSKYNNKIEVKPIVKKKVVKQEYFSKEELQRIEKISIQDAFNVYIFNTIPNLTEQTRKILNDLDEKYGRNIDISKDFEWGDYSLLTLKLSNFLGYPVDETIVLFNDQGVYSILGENRVGKSSIFSAIKFCLFNSTPHNSTMLKKMINKHNRSKNCYVECIISKNGKLYSIKRVLTPKKDGVSITLDFDEIGQNGEIIKSLKGEKRQDSEKEIQKMFGTENFFDILTSFSAQKRQIEFIDCKNSERLTLVNRFLGLQSFEEKEKEVTNDLKSKKAVYLAYEKDFNKSINLVDLELELTKKQIDVDDNKDELKGKELTLSQFLKQNEEFLKQWNKTKVISEKKVESPEEVKTKILSIEKEINLLKETIIVKETDIATFTEKLENLKNVFFNKTDQDIKVWKADYKFNNDLEAKIAVNTSEIKKLRKQIQIDICSGCGKEFTEKDKKRCEKEIEVLEKENSVYESEAKEKDKVQQVLIELQMNYNNIGRNISTLQTEILRLNSDISQKINIKEKYQIQSDEYEEVQEAKKLLFILKEQLDRYNKTKSEIEKEVIRLNVAIKGDEEKVKNIEREITTYKLKVKQLQELESEISLLKSYKDIIHKDGLPLYILKSKIEDINNQTNVIINQVFDFDIEFEIDEDAGDLNINFVYPEDIESNDAGLASGSETFLINLAIKTGIAQISDIPKMDSLLIDEGFGTLDSVSIQKIPNLFEAINKYYRNIITISHLDELKDMADHPIKLQKVGKYTQVTV